ncbi:hypothetical protein BGW38_005257 [Lunasporangiospora selenospora]|uniref:Sepiapterin reductase n=1 Tax=Lunasporangiospora selenospora TaxID=979761 RepID=A0A9P6KH70_9FUNG|nr:hypothetical protein BGW38_005257 [Lunasporangiospora selenospora]
MGLRHHHHLLIITGANRGFGKSIARSYIAHSNVAAISFVLVGRNHDALQGALDELTAQATDSGVALKSIIVGNVDLAKTDALDGNLGRISEAAAKLRSEAIQSDNAIQQSILINNAGSLGNLAKTAKEITWQDTRNYLDFNVVSFVGLCSSFLKDTLAAFPKELHPEHKTTIVNISSLLAVQAFSNWSLYAVGKAARNRFLGVIALEEKANNVKTLSYAPGPLDNEMQADVRRTLGDDEQLQIYDNMHKQGNLVNMDDSSKKLVLLLTKDEYESGSHIDFYDP